MTVHAAPKPKAAPPKKRQFSSIIDKRSVREKIAAAKKLQARRSPPPKKKRKPSEFARIYGSRARVAWVKAQSCVACGVRGFSENAHITTGGMGRKSDAANIVPLCGPRFYHPSFGGVLLTEGCHSLLHRDPQKFAAKFGEFDWKSAAAYTEAQWQAVAARGDIT